MSAKSTVFLAIMVFAIMASAAANFPLATGTNNVAAARKAARANGVNPRAGNWTIFDKLAVRQATVTVTVTEENCSPVPVPSRTPEVPEVKPTETPQPPVAEPTPSAPATESVPEGTPTPVVPGPSASESSAKETPIITPSSTQVAPPAPTSDAPKPTTSNPVVPINHAVRNGALEGVMFAAVVGFAALVAM
ncbi:hypothetical protein AJ79_02394 [Helicocarpus griseus UAMH5409]|uniref:Uncharacterized protein n=1 Tax=Helicocarpus griseus UAMH5409 TaxID=1447875 RepID=A0A2B7Y3L5_9EURO|nr:hypothetical protein AJ79_02394 [Helicocarpus griseus UAMH5409]